MTSRCPAGQAANVSGVGSIAYYTQPISGPDAWDAWCAARDSREERLVSARYVPREMIGIEDLDANGTWTVMAGYGPVWAPPVSRWAGRRTSTGTGPGWRRGDGPGSTMPPGVSRPFHYGRWAFVERPLGVDPGYRGCAPRLCARAGRLHWRKPRGSFGGRNRVVPARSRGRCTFPRTGQAPPTCSGSM